MNKLYFGDCLDSLNKLVNRFNENIDDYKSSRYDEENTKIDFIDKFFALLGWDVYNDQGFSEDLREVIREDKLVYRGMTISPDYAFRTGKERQFFVEAKKPSVNIKEGIEPAFQVRRYAYTAKLPVSILTDFEEFAVYDTRIMPNHKDKAGTARIFYCNYLEYEKNLEFLFNTFSKTAVWQGKLKRYTEDNKKKKGTQPIDKAMLATIDGWRNEIARNIALRNKHLDIYQLNEAVQKIIDRIIFLRIAEDRNTEIERSLEIITEQPGIYDKLVKYFDSANNKYNSGLFRIVDWIDSLTIDDKTFKDIIKDLYFPSPYEFKVLPIEILGQIYEQFLGKTIRLTPGHQAKVEEKPEVRKAGGVYYTPQYIVNYIVENTVGKKIGATNSGGELKLSVAEEGASQDSGGELKLSVADEGASHDSGRELKLSVADDEAPRNRRLQPSAIEKLRVLDPACGSGSFLVGAFNYLLNYHLEYYTIPQRRKKALKDGAIYQVDADTFRLTIREKRKILLNNIYGVDIDPQAVEVTKLSLLLKLMEGEITESRGELFLKSISEALLPDLKDNIKCGNSLIGTDFYADKDLTLFDPYEQRKINCFDWEVEFPEVFNCQNYDSNDSYDGHDYNKSTKALGSKNSKNHTNHKNHSSDGGFDCVIGNPPWGASLSEKELDYLRIKNKDIIVRMIDSYMYFTYKQSKFNLKQDGYFGMILPDVLLYQKDNLKLRKFIADEFKIENIINTGNVFEKVNRPSTIIIFTNDKNNNSNKSIKVLNISKIDKLDKENYLNERKNYDSYKQKEINKFPDYIFVTENSQKYSIYNKILSLKVKNLDEFIDSDGIQRGVSPDLKKAFIVTDEIINGYNLEKEKLEKTLTGGRHVKRYFIHDEGLKLIYNTKKDNLKYIPNVCSYIDQFKNEITCKEVAQGKHSIYVLHRARKKEIFLKDEVLLGVITGDKLSITLTNDKYIVTDGLFLFSCDKELSSKYILAILNSKLFIFIYRLITSETGRILAQVKPTVVSKLPIRIIDFSNKAEKAQHDRMVNLVEQMLEAQKEAHSGKSTDGFSPVGCSNSA